MIKTKIKNKQNCNNVIADMTIRGVNLVVENNNIRKENITWVERNYQKHNAY